MSEEVMADLETWVITIKPSTILRISLIKKTQLFIPRILREDGECSNSSSKKEDKSAEATLIISSKKLFGD